jgi:hypothetical protein
LVLVEAQAQAEPMQVPKAATPYLAPLPAQVAVAEQVATSIPAALVVLVAVATVIQMVLMLVALAIRRLHHLRKAAMAGPAHLIT